MNGIFKERAKTGTLSSGFSPAIHHKAAPMGADFLII